MKVIMQVDKSREFPRDNKISSIKALRQLTGLGLKEAKDAVEVAQDAFEDYVLFDLRSDIPMEEAHRLMVDLEALINVKMEIRSSDTVEKIKDLVDSAIKNSEYDLAIEMIRLVKEYS